MKILYGFIVATTIVALILVSEGCKGRNNSFSTANDNNYDTICLEDVDIVDIADTCAADTVVDNYIE